MQSKPLIGLNADYRAATKDQPAFSFLCAGYYDSIVAAGGIPIILPPLEEDESIEAILDQLQGFVLVGGSDLDSRRDHFRLHPSARMLASRREVFDRKLVHLLAERRIPVFGIGVGMQLLNIEMGGNLMLHIPEDMPMALPHKDRQDRNHRHSIEVTPGSLMERVYGDGEIRINSMHHMAIDEVADGFAVTARCPDGIIEAIEYQGEDWTAIGTQFHPESESASALDQRIFDEYIFEITGVNQQIRLAA